MIIKWDLYDMDYEGENRAIPEELKDFDRILMLYSLERQLGEMHDELGYIEFDHLRDDCYQMFEKAMFDICEKRKRRTQNQAVQSEEFKVVLQGLFYHYFVIHSNSQKAHMDLFCFLRAHGTQQRPRARKNNQTMEHLAVDDLKSD